MVISILKTQGYGYGAIAAARKIILIVTRNMIEPFGGSRRQISQRNMDAVLLKFLI